MKLYFAYGANLNLDSMSRRCPAAQQVSNYYLTDWRLAFSGVATIQPCKGSRVPGALWHITDACEDSLDVFEGFPEHYSKQYLDTDVGTIMFYVMNHAPPQPPGIWYLRTIAEGYEDWDLDSQDLNQAVMASHVNCEHGYSVVR